MSSHCIQILRFCFVNLAYYDFLCNFTLQLSKSWMQFRWQLYRTLYKSYKSYYQIWKSIFFNWNFKWTMHWNFEKVCSHIFLIYFNIHTIERAYYFLFLCHWCRLLTSSYLNLIFGGKRDLILNGINIICGWLWSDCFGNKNIFMSIQFIIRLY